jgi:hypothetical protein
MKCFFVEINTSQSHFLLPTTVLATVGEWDVHGSRTVVAGHSCFVVVLSSCVCCVGSQSREGEPLKIICY